MQGTSIVALLFYFLIAIAHIWTCIPFLHLFVTRNSCDKCFAVPRFWFSSRFAMALLGFVGFLSMSSQRMCINVAMDCMLNHTALSLLQQHQQLPPAKQHLQQHEGGEFQAYTSTSFHSTATATDNTSSFVSEESGISNSDNAFQRPCAGMPDIYVLNTSQFHYFNVSLSLILK